jgi:hypothetical protein
MTRDPRNHGNYAAPWTDRGVEYGPVSVRSGKMTAQSTAERDWAESIDAIPTAEHSAGGLWDHEADGSTRQAALERMSSDGRPISRHWPHKPLDRYDELQMRRFVERHASKLTARHYEVYKLFWEGRWSYGQIALRLGVKKQRILECVHDLRCKCRAASCLPEK